MSNTTLAGVESQRRDLKGVFDKLIELYKKANGWNPVGDQCPYQCILPDISLHDLESWRDQLDPDNSAQPPKDLLALFKDDLQDIHGETGHVEFKGLTALLREGSNKKSTILLFQFPRGGETILDLPDYGVRIYLDPSGFSLDYDFRPELEHYLIRLNDIKLGLQLGSSRYFDPPSGATPQLSPIFTTPAVAMTVQIRIPKHLDLSLDWPSIFFEFSGFRIELDINFSSLGGWSPLKLSLPDWLKWPFGPLDFGALLGSNPSFDCNCEFAFGDSLGWRIPKGWTMGLDFAWLKSALQWVLGLVSGGNMFKPEYFTTWEDGKSIFEPPDWAAIYLNLSGMCEYMLGDFAPQRLHIFAGFHKQSCQAKIGFLTCTGPLGLLGDKPLVFHSALQTDSELKPGFSVEILNDPSYQTLVGEAGCGWPVAEAKADFSCLEVRADRLDIRWEKDEQEYAFFMEGAVIIKELLKDPGKANGHLTLPIKGIGVTTSGRLVLKQAWNTLKQTRQVKLDGLDAVVLYLLEYGYGKVKESGGGTEKDVYWFGFTGAIELPGLGVKAGVDRLVFRTDGEIELSGVAVELETALYQILGAVKWGDALNGPKVPGAGLEGFGGQLALNIPSIRLDTSLGLTYVQCTLPTESFTAWSFFLSTTLPCTIPVCVALGIRELGLLVAQNFQPKPKADGLSIDRWLDQGFDGNVNNILNAAGYWSAMNDRFSAGFLVGMATSGDNGFILSARAILVLVMPGPIIMIAGKANVLSLTNPGNGGAFDLLIVYDQDDPGLLVSLAYRYDVKYLLTIQGMAELYLSFTDRGGWHFYLGTPARPIGARFLSIFESKGYLTISPKQITAGSMVYYGNKWSFGPITVAACFSFSADLIVNFNPIFVDVGVKVLGEAKLRIFGIGLGVGLSVGLSIRVPTYWYLHAEVKARFSISLLFFTWSFTASIDFSWGTEEVNPEPLLGNVHDAQSCLSLNTNAVDGGASLLPSGDGAPATYRIPMDGVIGLGFLRDIEIDLPGEGFPKFAATTPVEIEDEKSLYSVKIEFFHARLENMKLQRQTNTGGWQDYQEQIYFTWDPRNEEKRKLLCCRTHDKGYSRFKLNDDPNASVELTCPDFYRTELPLALTSYDESLESEAGLFAVNSPLLLRCLPPAKIEVALSQDPADKYEIDCGRFSAKLSFTPAVRLERLAGGTLHAIISAGAEIEFSEPAAYVLFDFLPIQASGPGVRIEDLFALFDKRGDDITAHCQNALATGPGSSGFRAILNDFGNGPRFDTQLPPALGVKKVRFLKSGRILPRRDQKCRQCHLYLYPHEVLRDIHRRNTDRLKQRAELEYTFEQNQDPGRILWDPGQYRISGETKWQIGPDAYKDPEGGSPHIQQAFEVIPPFEKVVIEVNGEKRDIQPFAKYLRRLTPDEGQRPVYRDQCPGVTYSCNYVNAMLQTGQRRLAMVLEDASGEPCRYVRLVLERVPLEAQHGADLWELSRGSRFRRYQNLGELEKKAPEVLPGLTTSVLKKAYGASWRDFAGRSQEVQANIRLRTLVREDLLHKAQDLGAARKRRGETEGSDRVKLLEKSLQSKFDPKFGQAVIVRVGDRIDLLGVGFMTGLVEYRYTNDDLALDVSSLILADCLPQNQARKLNAYERGYFAPVIPGLGIWNGPKAETAYTAKIYCLGENHDLEATRDGLPVIYDFHFTTSRYLGLGEIKQLLEKPKIREAGIWVDQYEATLKHLGDAFARPAFAHPAGLGVEFPVGMELFRELAAESDIIDGFIGTNPTTREIEEKLQGLMDDKTQVVRQRLQEEGLVMDAVLAELGCALDPPGGQKIFGTWLRLWEEEDLPQGTLGLLIEFPEPLDWQRTGIAVSDFRVQHNNQATELDILNLTASAADYEATLYWLRSADGTRLLLIPKLVHTHVAHPRVSLRPPDPHHLRPGALELRPTAETILNREVAEGLQPQPEPCLETGKARLTGQPQVRLSDRARASTAGFRDPMAADRLKARFGRNVVKNIWDYEVTALSLEFYYFAGNYEEKRGNFRAVPRLRFRHPQPLAQDGRIAALTLKQ